MRRGERNGPGSFYHPSGYLPFINQAWATSKRERDREGEGGRSDLPDLNSPFPVLSSNVSREADHCQFHDVCYQHQHAGLHLDRIHIITWHTVFTHKQVILDMIPCIIDPFLN